MLIIKKKIEGKKTQKVLKISNKKLIYGAITVRECKISVFCEISECT